MVHELGLACAVLPMDFDPEYTRDGINWYSGCSEMSDIFQWFSPKEIAHLEREGFGLFRFETDYVRDYFGHQVFSKQHLRSVAKVDFGGGDDEA